MQVAGALRRIRLTRALYAPVILFAPAIAAYGFVVAWIGYFVSPPLPFYTPQPPLFLSFIALGGYVLPGALACRRILLTRELIPDKLLSTRPIVAFLVATFSLITLVLVWFVIYVLADAGRHAYQGDLGPLGGVLMLAAISSAIALLVGELVLARGDRPSTAR
jgi:hypothetical protein